MRQKGYVRPQGVTFAPSAGNRDSVLSLGSIAHLQYYFARTGLLDGKGGQLAKEDKTKTTKPMPRVYDSPESAQSTITGLENADGSKVDPGIDEPLMLPPTVSTYSHRVQYIPPPPDSETLRQDLKTTLHEARKALHEVQEQERQTLDRRKQEMGDATTHKEDENRALSAFSQSSGWYEVQGMHVLDVVTLAIRAAKMYYTSHDEPQRLYSIKSERQIRQELYAVLDTLKKMASRKFAGGMRDEELHLIRQWLEDIEGVLSKEEAVEEQDKKTRDSWEWLEGSWEGRERERERQFLTSFLADGDVPEWTAADAAEPKPTPFLEMFRTGVTLIHLHNALLKKSKRQFGDIKVFHTDTAKPYRCAENLRYWIKAAEIRWETKLKVNVTGVVNSKNEAWFDFDLAILQWSRAVRQELTKEWRDATLHAPKAALYAAEQAKQWSDADLNSPQLSQYSDEQDIDELSRHESR